MRETGGGATSDAGRRRLPGGPLALAVLGIGLLVRLVLARSTVGNAFDLHSYEIVAAQLRGGQPFDLYATVNDGLLPRWPYLPGYLPVVWLTAVLHGPVAFATAIRLPAVAADLAIALLVADVLRRRGATDRVALAGLACVALGPTFIALSGHHGQLDAPAILPAVAALWLRSRRPERFDLVVGSLLGLAIACKTAPGMLLLAFVPATPTWPRRWRVLAGAAAVPAVVSLPFLLASPGDLVRGVTYRGLPGIGGFSVLVQPDLAPRWLAGAGNPLEHTAATDVSQALAAPILLGALAVAAVLLHRADRSLAARCVGLWATFFACSTNFSLGYVVWALPFVVVGLSPRWGWAVHLALVVPLVVVYGTAEVDGWPDAAIRLGYVPYVVALQAALLVVVVRGGRALRLSTPRGAPAPGRSRSPG